MKALKLLNNFEVKFSGFSFLTILNQWWKNHAILRTLVLDLLSNCLVFKKCFLNVWASSKKKIQSWQIFISLPLVKKTLGPFFWELSNYILCIYLRNQNLHTNFRKSRKTFHKKTLQAQKHRKCSVQSESRFLLADIKNKDGKLQNN